ncbi:MAG: alpha/beta hydrolase fold protein [Candidatus Eremiobacteraeota bacterium]|nr:alpha/beta hydrolase fold protein [Candidatus Eremiobacteraeota bacterium]
MLDPQARAFLDHLATLDQPPLETMPLADARALFEETFTRLGGAGVAVGDVRAIVADGPCGPIPVRLYTPEAASEPLPLIVFYHGGGWVNGSLDSYDAVCRLLTRESGCKLASVDYRRAPEHPAPEPFEDAYAALEWLSAHAAELGADPARIAVAGDSAGGALAAGVTLKARDAGGPPIAHQLLVYPAVADDAETDSIRAYGAGHFLTRERMEFYYTCYIPRHEIAELPYVIALKSATLRGLPPATIVLAACDPLYDQGVAYAERLRADGVAVDLRVYPGMIHAFFSFIAIFEQGRAAVSGAGKALGAALASRPVER